jgi:outer membrane protein
VVAILTIVLALQGSVFAAADFVVPLEFEVPDVVGLSVGVVPDYEGSDDYMFGALPALNLQFENRHIRLLGSYVEVNILNHDALQLGPIARYRFGRDNDIEDEVIKEIHEVDDSFEVGAFAGFLIRDKQNPRIRYGASLSYLQDVSDGHDGFTIQASARAWYPASKAIDLGIAGGGTYASDDYMSAYFDVTGADFISSGLPVYDAEEGLKDVYVQPMMMVHLSKSWHLGAGVRIKVFRADARYSPVVDDRGSDTQVIAGVGVAYAW